jgi:hypothetical protein
MCRWGFFRTWGLRLYGKGKEKGSRQHKVNIARDLPDKLGNRSQEVNEKGNADTDTQAHAQGNQHI